MSKTNKDLNAVVGLYDHLMRIKDQCSAMGIDGFAFLTEEQNARRKA